MLRFGMGLRSGEFPGREPKFPCFVLRATFHFCLMVKSAPSCWKLFLAGWEKLLSLLMAVFFGKIVNEPTSLAEK